MSEETESTETSDFEKRFFGGEGDLEPGAPLPDDYVDPELLSLDAETSFSQMLLVLLVAGLAAVLAWQYKADLAYVFSPNEPMELGHAEELQFDGAVMVGGNLELPNNRYVAVDGLAEWPVTAGNLSFYKLLGAHIYVQLNTRAEEVEPEPETRPALQWSEDSFRPIHDEPGRLVPFRDLPQRYESMIDFYSNNYAVHYCGFEPSQEYRRFLNNQRGRVELILLDELGRQPSEEEIEERLGPLGTCQEAYLLVAGVSPSSYRYFIAVYAVLALILLGSLWLVGKRMLEARKRAAAARG